MTHLEAANKYLDLGWFLTPIPLKTKAPKKPGWNTPAGWVDSKQKAEVDFSRPANMGVILGPSKLCILDVDSVKNTRLVFEEYGFDYDILLAKAPRIRGAKQDRDKAVFKYPEGYKLEFHKLIWGSSPKETTVFELRCGNVQDVLPPSIHPEGHAYEWVKDPFSGIPDLPRELLNLWVHFKSLEDQLKKIDPAARPEPKPRQERRDGHENIIGQFNAAHDIERVLESFGYKKRGKRFLSPNSSTGMAGVSIFRDGGTVRCVSKHGDSLNDGHAHDAFDVFRILKHEKNFTEAVKDAAQILGIKFEPQQRPAPPAPSKIQARLNSSQEMDEMFRDISEQRAGKKITIEFPWKILSDKSRALRPGTVLLLAGPSKAGKSYLIMSLIIFLHDRGVNWKYLPLEDARKDWMWRALAILENDYEMTDDRPQTADRREAAFIRHCGKMETLIENVYQNPRVGIVDKEGNAEIPPLPYGKILNWAKENVRKNRILVIDPFAQIEFSNKTAFNDQADLMRGLLGAVTGTECTLIINMHTTKGSQEKPLSLDNVQGSADLVRLAHSILLFDAHEFKETSVVKEYGGFDTVSHNRTLTIAAVRNGSGSRSRIAFTQGMSGPSFIENGVIAPKKVVQRDV